MSRLIEADEVDRSVRDFSPSHQGCGIRDQARLFGFDLRRHPLPSLHLVLVRILSCWNAHQISYASSSLREINKPRIAFPGLAG